MTSTFSPLSFAPQAQDIAQSVTEVVMLDQTLMEDLLRGSGAIDEVTLEQVQQSAFAFKKSIVDVLFQSGFIASADLKALLSAHNYVKKGLLHKPWALSALRRSLTEFLPFEDLLESMELSPVTAFTDSYLTELCLMSSLITPQEFDRARCYALSCGLTLGQSLVRCGFISLEAYKILLNGLAMQQSGIASAVTTRQNVNRAGLRRLSSPRIPLSHSLVAYGACYQKDSEPALLGALELLVAAQCVNELSLLGLIEVSLERGRTFMEMYDELSILSPVVLETALKMQALVVRGTCTHAMAIQVLKDTVRS